MNEKELLGAKITNARKSANVSQLELAEMVGIQQSHLSRIENGRYMPRVDIVARIADALGCKIDDLVK